MNGYSGKERRSYGRLSESEIEEISDKAAQKALQIVYGEVGKGVVKKLLWLVGLIIFSIAYWLFKSGRLVL